MNGGWPTLILLCGGLPYGMLSWQMIFELSENVDTLKMVVVKNIVKTKSVLFEI